MFRTPDATKIVQSLDLLSRRIDERFRGGAMKVAAEFTGI
jgi:hypothetical protein